MAVVVTGADLRNDLRPTSSFPAPYGLLSVVQTPAPGDPHWVNGINFEHSDCSPVSGISGDCGDTPLGIPYVFTVGGVTAVSTPFTLYGTYTCTPVGTPISRAADYAREHLDRHEQEGIEDAISSGALLTTPTFAGATDLTPTPGTAVPLAYAIGLLSDHAASVFGTAGTIHAPRITAGLFQDIATRVDSHLETLAGDLVALGGGYANESPTGSAAAAGTAWLYVTPPVAVVSSETRDYPPSPAAGLDRLQNDLIAVAERTYLVAWDDCTLGAVLVDLSPA